MILQVRVGGDNSYRIIISLMPQRELHFLGPLSFLAIHLNGREREAVFKEVHHGKWLSSLVFGLSFSCLDMRKVCCVFRQYVLESVARNKQAVRSK